LLLSKLADKQTITAAATTTTTITPMAEMGTIIIIFRSSQEVHLLHRQEINNSSNRIRMALCSISSMEILVILRNK